MIGWADNWNTIIRNIIWPDTELRTLMKIPPKTTILQFIDKYFIKAGFTNKLLTDEPCRIIYSDIQGSETKAPNVLRSMLVFDIYVKQSELHNIGDDRLRLRTDLIADRLFKILTGQRYVADTGYRFWIAGDWDMGTRVTGYSRKTIALKYMKVY